MKNFSKKLMFSLFYTILLYAGAVMVGSFMATGKIAFDRDALSSSMTVNIFVLGMLIMGLMWLTTLGSGKSGGGGDNKLSSSKGKDKTGKELEQYYDKTFMTEKDLMTNDKLNYCNMKTIRDKKKAGILIRAEKKGKDLEINFINPIHTLIIGTTGQGKSTQYYMPFLQIMSRVKNKPSFVVGDPKDELRKSAYNTLIEEGYDVKVLDLTDPYASLKWNPMQMSFVKFHQGNNIETLVKIHSAGDKPKEGLMIAEVFDYRTAGWYEFCNRAYVTQQQLIHDMEVKKKALMSEAINDLNDFCLTICPTEDKNQPTWEDGARNFIQGVAQAMLEDSLDPKLGMTLEKFIPYNLAKICMHKDIDGRDQFASLKKYFQYRDKFSLAQNLASTVISAPENTAKSYLSVLNSKLGLFNDKGICLLTSTTELNLKDIARKPTAFFLRIPDYIKTRHPLAMVCFTQTYKALVEEAYEQNPIESTLDRQVFFMLDEFANLPKFPDFGTTISVARSRGIFYLLAIQSYSQLDGKYGKEESAVIYDNTPITIYFGTNDLETNEKLSKKLGNRTIELTKVNKSTGGKEGKDKSESTSRDAVSIPLIDPQKLPTINQGGGYNLIVDYVQFKSPVMAVFTPIYMAKDIYDCSAPRLPYTPIEAFDENKVFYDIIKRNKLVAQPSSSDDDDDFFN